MIFPLMLAASIATVPPDQAWIEKRQEMAYVMGRCDFWLDAEMRSTVQMQFDKIDHRLWSLYIDGLRDGRKEPLARSVCVKMMIDLREEMER